MLDVGRAKGGDSDFRTGQAVGDAVATVVGTAQTLFGGGEAILTAPAAATGVGALVPAAGVVMATGGAGAAITGGANLANSFASAIGPKEGVSGGPGGGKRIPDQVKTGALDENQAANNGQAKCVFCGDPVGEGTGNKINYDHASPKSQNGRWSRRRIFTTYTNRVTRT